MKVVEVALRLGDVDGEPLLVALSGDDSRVFETHLNDVPWDVGTAYDNRLQITMSDDGIVQSVAILTATPEVTVIEAAEEDDGRVPGELTG